MHTRTAISSQLHVRLNRRLMDDVRALARRRRLCYSQLVRQVLKLQEASIPGGVTLSRRLLEDAARAAIERIELVEAKLRQDARP